MTVKKKHFFNKKNNLLRKYKLIKKISFNKNNFEQRSKNKREARKFHFNQYNYFLIYVRVE